MIAAHLFDTMSGPGVALTTLALAEPDLEVRR